MSTLSAAKKAWAMEQLAPLMKNGVSPVIVLPLFDEDGADNWVPIESEHVTANANSTSGFGYMQLFQTRTVFGEGVQFDNDLWAIHRAKTISLETQYHAGQILPGNIVIKDTLVQPNPNNVEQDLKMTRVSKGNTVACSIDDQAIYSTKYWDPTGTKADITIEHNNQQAIEESIKQATVAAALAAGKLKGVTPETTAPKSNALTAGNRKPAGAKA